MALEVTTPAAAVIGGVNFRPIKTVPPFARFRFAPRSTIEVTVDIPAIALTFLWRVEGGVATLQQRAEGESRLSNVFTTNSPSTRGTIGLDRSEERRVGKECR